MNLLKLLIWKNYTVWFKKIFSSPKYYIGIFLWIPVFAVNMYVSLMLVSVLVYGVIAWGFFSLLGDPGFVASSISYNTKQTETPVTIDSTGKTFVACCISGGGSRSAIFSGEILELVSNLKGLDDNGHIFQDKNTKNINVLDTFDFISSVSGGSIAATSLCIERPWEKNTAEAWQKYKKKLRIPYQQKLYQYLANPLYFGETALTHRDRTNIMQKVWDDFLVDNKKIGDLPLRPRLLVNATLYNTGRKFVFTTLPKSNFDDILELYPFLFANLDPFPAQTATLDQFFLSNVNCPLSTAVAASSAFPVGLPPVTIHGYSDSQKTKDSFLHLSDGGIYDNHGIETVIQLFRQSVNKYYQGKEMRIYGGIVFVIDASLPLKEKFALSSPNEFDMIMHTVEVYEKRMQMYFDRFLQEQISVSDKIQIPLHFVRFSISELIGMWELSLKTKEERDSILVSLEENLQSNVHVGSQKHVRSFIKEWFQKPDVWWQNFRSTCKEFLGDNTDSFMKELQEIPTNLGLNKKDTKILEKASSLIFKLKEESIIETFQKIENNTNRFNSVENMTVDDVRKNPFLYVFEFMRQTKMGNKSWKKNNIRTAIENLPIPAQEKRQMKLLLEEMETTNNNAELKKFENYYQRTFQYIQQEESKE